MPTISVDKVALFKALGKEYTTAEFDELCFDFGVELDEDTSTSERPLMLNGEPEPAQLKIEVPANRYDMLCFEGIARALNIFFGRIKAPNYRVVDPADGQLQLITVHKETSTIRPYVAGAVLRNITFDQARYNSFISLQDKLHQNLARQRTLVAIGTHDLDVIKGPFTYEALPPEEINFVPLNQEQSMSGQQLMKFYEYDKHLGRYLHIIRESPVYPVIYDSNRTVCSLPPIINGNHSKITLDTKNVFIEITATDKTKLDIVCNVLVTMFSEYTKEPFTVEPVKIISPHNAESRLTPDLTARHAETEISYINGCCGLTLSADDICKLLARMSHQAAPSESDPGLVDVHIPATRADVLHQCDIMEDVAVGYGFNNLPKAFPGKSGTVAQPLMVNKLGDIVRIETALAGWNEVMPLVLCSHDENFAWLNREDDGQTAVKLANPKTAEYQVVRTSLLPGLLKTVRENKHHSMPIKVFEVSDVAFKDLALERKSRNERHFAAAWCGKTSGFEVVHGLLDRLMLMLKTAFLTHEEGLEGMSVDGYWIEEADDPTFFPGHAATIHVRVNGANTTIGSFGILHPTVLHKFELKYVASGLILREAREICTLFSPRAFLLTGVVRLRYPVSAIELNLEVFL
ncbi:MAG: phenylalanine--tRNA ligase subunit beta [Phylliscum demangeonii]|nr:MAG: phenylalanine--tRNA ligase subunit beta [Phylliscum demangeonii]